MIDGNKFNETIGANRVDYKHDGEKWGVALNGGPIMYVGRVKDLSKAREMARRLIGAGYGIGGKAGM